MNKDIVTRSIAHYGKALQLAVCMEECAELIQAISKDVRGQRTARDHIVEELADVVVCIEMLQQIYKIEPEEIDEWIDLKQRRMQERITGKA